MNRSTMVRRMAREAGISTGEARVVLDSFVGQGGQALRQGEPVRGGGLGVFKPCRRAARRVVHPVTGEEVRIPGCTVARFVAGKRLRDSIG